ncbi:MAG: Diadenylate cyclase spyDAC [Myxococcaceae bacterium]|nr:Diadenylate cyclase spyDAC [Myxococcaceae bacterium]
MQSFATSLTAYAGHGLWNLLVDTLDIIVVAVVIYRLLLLIRGTRALQMGVGLLLVFVVYELSRWLGLLTLYSLLDGLLTSMVLIIVVIFQGDIRRALMRFGGRAWWVPGSSAKATSAIEEVIKAATMLAQKRIGGLIVFERDAMLEEFIQRGTLLDSVASKELLYGLFIPSFENPLHDGAVVVRDGRVWQAGAFLPLTTNPDIDRTLGSRHRAALGISEETDAVVVVVSEERGSISLVFNGNMVRDVDATSLRDALPGLLFRRMRRKKKKTTPPAASPSRHSIPVPRMPTRTEGTFVADEPELTRSLGEAAEEPKP